MELAKLKENQKQIWEELAKIKENEVDVHDPAELVATLEEFDVEELLKSKENRRIKVSNIIFRVHIDLICLVVKIRARMKDNNKNNV